MDDIDFNKLIFHAENRIMINTDPPVYVPNTFLLKSDMLKTLAKVYMADPSRENDEFGNPLLLKLDHENISPICWVAFTQSTHEILETEDNINHLVYEEDFPSPKSKKTLIKNKLFEAPNGYITPPDEYDDASSPKSKKTLIKKKLATSEGFFGFPSPKHGGKKASSYQYKKSFINNKYVTEPTELDNIVYLCIKYGLSSEYMFDVIRLSEYNAFGSYVFPKIQEMQSNKLITDLIAHIFREACKEFGGPSRRKWYDQVKKTSPWLYDKLTQYLIQHHIHAGCDDEDELY